MEREAGVEHAGQFLPAELGQSGAADLGTIQQAPVGGIPQGVVQPGYLHSKAEVGGGVGDGVLADLRLELGAVREEGRVLVQRRHLQALDGGTLPPAAAAQVLMVRLHLREEAELGGIVVLTRFGHRSALFISAMFLPAI